MKAVTWHGRRDVRVEEVPDPTIKEPTTRSCGSRPAVCGSDLHLYETLGPFMGEGDILGHEPMGIVEEVGSEAGDLKVGDRVVMPFQICCGHCWMCSQGLQTQCETTQVREQGMGAALFGSASCTAGARRQAEFLRVPQARACRSRSPRAAGRAVPVPVRRTPDRLAVGDVRRPRGGTLLILGLGPIGDMAAGSPAPGPPGDRRRPGPRAARPRQGPRRRGHRPVGRGRRRRGGPLADPGPGADAVIDAVGMEAHGSPVAEMGQRLFNVMPKRLSATIMNKAGLDRMSAIYTAIDAVRRGGTVSLIGVYGGQSDPMPMLTMFDKQLQFRMGQANIKRWVDDIMPLVVDDADPPRPRTSRPTRSRWPRRLRRTRTSRRSRTARSRWSSSPDRGQLLWLAFPPLRPAFFFWAVVPPWELSPPEPLFCPPCLDASGELAIFAARSFDMPLSLRASYCFSFLTAIANLLRERVTPDSYASRHAHSWRITARESGYGFEQNTAGQGARPCEEE